MKKSLILLSVVVAFFSCQPKQEVDLQYVLENFETNASKIESISYKAHRIDTFPSDHTGVWNNRGFVHIEKVKEDRVFGFSFYGENIGFQSDILYDDDFAFIISEEAKQFVLRGGDAGLLGSPGGQMIAPNIFDLDSVYKHLELVITDTSYVLNFEFATGEQEILTLNEKVIELDKNTFTPMRVTNMREGFGNRFFHQITITDIKINDTAAKSIATYKNEFSGYEEVADTGRSDSVNLVGKASPRFRLPYLDGSKEFTLGPGKLTLIDFWEVWCGGCIIAFPKVAALNENYADDLDVIGIATENREGAQNLAIKKGATFINLYGSKEVLEMYEVNVYPRYVLVDKKGIVIGEYTGFSKKIEEDIKKELGG